MTAEEFDEFITALSPQFAGKEFTFEQVCRMVAAIICVAEYHESETVFIDLIHALGHMCRDECFVIVKKASAEELEAMGVTKH